MASILSRPNVLMQLKAHNVVLKLYSDTYSNNRVSDSTLIKTLIPR